MREQLIPMSVRFAGVALGLTALTACGETPPAASETDVTVMHILAGTIPAGVNVRSSPQRDELDPVRFLCTKTKAGTQLPDSEVKISSGTGADVNGDWVGVDPKAVKLSYMAKLHCPQKSLFKGLLWVNEEQGVTLTPSSVQLPTNTLQASDK